MIMDRKTIRKLQLAYWNGYDIDAACLYAGVAEEDYEKAIEADAEFARRMALAQLYPKVKAQMEMAHSIAKGDGQLAMQFLERRDPARYDPQYIRKFGQAPD